MNNKMHKSRWLPVLFALLMVANNASGQNFIREEHDFSDDEHSLIRGITDNSWIVYSYSGDNDFYRVINGTYMVNGLYFGNNIEVSDFEIFHDTIFFCGCLHGSTTYAVFGMFPIAGFPTCTIHYNVISGLKSFGKLAMLSIGGTTHAALTASYQDGYGTMVDFMMPSSTSWVFQIANRVGMSEVYDDVVALDDYVVFSSRYYGQSPKYGRVQLVYHSLPVPAGNTFLSTTPSLRYFDNNMLATSPVFMKACLGYQILTANTTAGSKISAGLFSGPNYYASAETPSQSGQVIRELGCNEFNLEYEVLTTVQNANAVGSIIYHFEHTNFMYNNILYTHYYVDQFLYSLYDAGVVDMLQVSCGHNITDHYLKLYRYKYTLYDCAMRKTQSSEYVEYAVTPSSLIVEVNPYYTRPAVLSHNTFGTRVHTICISREDEQDEPEQ